MVGKMLKLMRILRKLKQSELAKKVSIAESTISNYETEDRTITMINFINIASSLNFEVQIVDKTNNNIYKFDYVDRMNTDVRVIDKNR